MPPWPPPLWKSNYELNLTRMRHLCNELGNPELRLPPTIHITGTNGKGSTVAMLRAALFEVGCRVHTYTSPHLCNFNERIKLAGFAITDEMVLCYLDRVRIVCEKLALRPSFFEATTAAAFLAFSEHEADYLLLEVGMGGRLDPTNIIPLPLACIITTISLDHTDKLGPTLSHIAFEKAGIIKPGSKVIIGAQPEEAERVLYQQASSQGIEPLIYGNDFGITSAEVPGHFMYEQEEFAMMLPYPNLQGAHQCVNAAAAIAALGALKREWLDEGLLARALTKVHWPGRLQRVYPAFVSGQNEVWVDGAHNPEGSTMLADWLDEVSTGAVSNVLVVGLTKGKDIASYLEPFLGKLSCIYATDVPNEPSSIDATQLVEEASKLGFPAIACATYKEAFDKISSDFSGKLRIIVTGSLYLVANLLNPDELLR